MFAVDKSFMALRMAAENADKLGVAERICFINADWLSFLHSEKLFDLVVSNPPYVPDTDLPGLAPEVRDFEPALALDGGVGGLDCIRTLVDGVAKIVRKDGHIFFEIGFDQGPAVVDLLGRSGEYCEVVLHSDYAGLHRLVQARKK
jgi:release factor glutamine methyltransferase